MLRGYLISGLLILALFATAQYRGWSLVGASESRSEPGTPGAVRGIYHK